MPLYFAIPRRGGTTQTTDGDVSFVRTAPSSFIINSFSAVGFVISGLISMMSVVMAAILGASATSNSPYVNYFDIADYPSVPYADGIQFRIPDIVIAFKGRPSPADQEVLDSWHLEPEKIATVKKEVYILRNPTFEQAKAATEFSGLLEVYRPTNSAIAVQSILSFMDLASRITMISTSLKAIVCKHVFLKMEGGYTENEKMPPADPTTMEEGEEAEEDNEHWIQFGGRVTALSVFAQKITRTAPVWGTIEQFLAYKEDGIFCPFNQDFSAPDPTIIARFIQTFKDMFTSEYGEDADTDDATDIQQAWATEICTTMAGHHMAHIMMSLILAAESGAWAYTIQSAARPYEGTILVKAEGEMTIRGAGIRPVHSISFAELKNELVAYGFHTVTLQKILTLAGVTAVTPEQVGSMRYLRELVFAGNGIPDGATRNKISRLLPKLAFDEKPLGVNATTINQVMELLSSDTVIPRNLFLPAAVFFVDDSDRTRLIISAWGENPPTFNYGGTTLRATSVVGKGSSAKMADYVSTPPRVLQVKRVPMEAAVTGWNTLMSAGYIWGIYDRKLAQGRSFNGPEKTQVWNIIGKWAGISTVPKGTTAAESGPGIDTSMQKRKGDELTVGERGAAKKKRLFK